MHSHSFFAILGALMILSAPFAASADGGWRHEGHHEGYRGYGDREDDDDGPRFFINSVQPAPYYYYNGYAPAPSYYAPTPGYYYAAPAPTPVYVQPVRPGISLSFFGY